MHLLLFTKKASPTRFESCRRGGIWRTRSWGALRGGPGGVVERTFSNLAPRKSSSSSSRGTVARDALAPSLARSLASSPPLLSSPPPPCAPCASSASSASSSASSLCASSASFRGLLDAVGRGGRSCHCQRDLVASPCECARVC